MSNAESGQDIIETFDSMKDDPTYNYCRCECGCNLFLFWGLCVACSRGICIPEEYRES